MANARVIFEKATGVAFKAIDDLATVWCEYAEMELRARNVDGARRRRRYLRGRNARGRE